MPSFRLVPPQEWPTLGWAVIDWIERYLCHGPGDIEGQPLVLDDEMCQHILDAYRIYPQGHDRAGERVVRYDELSRPKGRAKSEVAAAVVCAELLGPVRFDRWDAAGQPIGKRVHYPFIRCLATEESQTGNTYSGVMSMLRHGIEHHPDVFRGLDVGLTRVLLDPEVWPGGGEVRPSTASAGAKDGGKETFAVADEVHLYKTPELREMHDTVRRNVLKRKAAQGWMLATTTMFAPGEDSIAERNFMEAEEQRKHPRKRRIGFCRDHREGGEVTNWDDDAELLAALAEGYGPAAEWMDLEGILENEIRAPGATQAAAQRYWLNQRATQAGRAVDAAAWDEMAAPLRTPSEGAEIVLCFDGSKLDDTRAKSPDATALLAWTVEEVPHLFTLGIWQPTHNDQRKLRAEVKRAVAEAKVTYKVRRLIGDRAHWQEQLDVWAEEFGEDPQGDDVVLVFDTNSGARMGPAIDRFVREGVPNRSFTHDGDPDLRRHVLNMVLTVTRRGGYSAVVKPKETEKIDAGVAAILGYHELPNVEPMTGGGHEPVVLFL